MRCPPAALRLFLLLYLLAWPLGAPDAEARPIQSEGQVWYIAFAQGPVDEGPFLYYFEAQPRASRDDALLILRSAVGLSGPGSLSVWAGYAWFPVLGREGRSSVTSGEGRFFQQLLYTADVGRIKVMGRGRLEQRLISGTESTAHRARAFFRGAYPLGESGTTYAVVWDEVFFHLNGVEQGPRAGFDQNRLFLGAGWKVSDHVSLEVGYLNAFLRQAGASNRRVIHAPYVFTIFNYL